MKKLKAGIIGAGARGVRSFGRQLIARSGEAELVALAEPNPLRLGAAGELLGGVPNLFADYNDLLAMDEIDMVFIAAPDAAHEELALAALGAGKHTLCEKPLAITAAGCRRIIDLARAAGRLLEVGFVLRYVPLFVKIKEIIDSGRIGPVRLVNFIDFYHGGSSYFRRWNRFRAVSGGLLIHKGSHDFDLVNWYAGSEPVRVSAMGGLDVFTPGRGRAERCRDCSDRCPEFFDITAREHDRRLFLEAEESDGYILDVCIFNSEKDTFDNSVANVAYANGVRAGYCECFFPARSRRTLTIVGDEGEIRADETENRIQVLYRHSDAVEELDLGDKLDGHGGGDSGQMNAFLEAVRGGGEARAPGEAGYWAVAVGEAAEISARENRVVAVDELLESTQ